MTFSQRFDRGVTLSPIEPLFKHYVDFDSSHFIPATEVVNG